VFDKYMEPAARVTAVEVRTPPAAADGRSVDAAREVLAPFAEAACAVSPEVRPFLEVARTQEWERGLANAVAGIAKLSDMMLRPLGAKIRTGGLTPDAFPTPRQVARFIAACRDSGVPFKATAGLHHPIRHHDTAADAMRHGFLNLLTAAGLSTEGADEDLLVAVIEETDPDTFRVGPTGLRWRDRRLSSATLRTLRREALTAYGSCSFDEPVTDLTSLGVLDVVTP
jgi:hypothetical protein